MKTTENKTNNAEVIRSFLDEFHYLVQNNKFLEATVKIRTKHKIPKNGFDNDKDCKDWWNKPVEDLKRFDLDLSELSSRCRFTKSKYMTNFLPMLRNYILTAKISHYFDTPVSTIPNLKINSSRKDLTLEIKLDADTSQQEISRVIRAEWKKIRKLQKLLGGSRLKPATQLEANIQLWKLFYKENCEVKKILEYIGSQEDITIPEDAWSIYGIKKIIKRTNLRINNSFM